MIYRWSAPLALFAALSLSFPQLQAEPTAVSKASRASGTKGQSQQITSPDQVPQGLAKSDWQSIRAAHEAGQHAFQPVQGKDGHWQARNPGQQWHTTFDQRGFMAIPQGGGWTWGLELQSYGFGQQQRAVQGKPGVRAEGQRLSYQWDEDVQEWFVNDQRGLEHGFTIVGRPAADSAPGSQPALLSFTLSTRGGLTPKVASDSVQFLNATGTTVLNYSGLKVWDADGKILPAHFEPAGIHGFRLLVDESTARYPITIDPVAQQAYLKAGNSGAGDSFGLSVAVSGDTAVVGAYLEDSNATGVNGNAASNDSNDSGAAYVFVRSAGVWTQQAYLKASNTDANDQFGWSVDVDGDTIVIGAWTEDGGAIGVNGDASNNGAIDSGAVYVFTRSGTTWTQQAYLKANNTGAGDLFGVSVALSGDTAVIGANREDSNATTVNGDSSNNTATEAGAAYVFTRSGTTWTQQAYLKANNHGPDDRFGSDVAVSGDTAVIGAPFEDSNATTVNGSGANNTASNAGAAYVFTRSGSAWTQQAYLKANNAETLDNFGNYLAVDGDTAVVGATGEDSNATTVNGLGSNNSASGAGAAYVFTRSGTTWSQQAYLKASNAEANDSFGRGVAVDGDTLVIGAAGEDSNATNINGDATNNSTPSSGAAYVFTRSGGLWSQQTYLKANNPDTTDNFGISVDTSGGTVIVGAYLEDSNAITINGNGLDNSASGSGAAYIFSGLGAAVAAPTLTNVAPNSGPTAGGTSVVITGTDFTGATDVTIGGTAATSFTVDSATQITAVTPAGTAGTASVLVTTTGGTNAANTLFTYIAPPSVTNVSPATGSTLGGTSVVITGTGFTGTSAVTFGGAAATSFTVDSATQITAVTPAGSAGTASVLVTTAGGTNAANTLFTYIAPPTVTNVSPATGSTLGGTSVTITGTGFTGTSAVTFGGTAATSFTVDSATQITAVTPAGSAGTASVLVTTAGGTNAANTLFTYTASTPLAALEAYLKAGNAEAGDFFGQVVAVSGDTAVVGAYSEGSNATGVNGNAADNSAFYSGAAYIFTRTAGVWTQQAYLKASNSEAYDNFGCSVAVSGDTVVIGAYAEASSATGVNGNQADNSALYSGAAYVFTRSGSTWTQQAYLKASNTGEYDTFGYSVAISGDTAIIGAQGESSNATGVGGNQADNSASTSGAAYVFTRSGSTWTQQAYLKASNTGEYDYFGLSVALSGDTAIIGAQGESSNATGVGGNQVNNSASFSGAAYIFSRSGSTWTQQAYLKASNSQVDGRFGRSVDVSGDTVVIGAYGEASNATGVNGNQVNNSAYFSGAAYIFSRSGSTWTQQAYLKASNSAVSDNFGLSVAVSGNTAVIGAFAEDSNATGVNGNQADNSTSASGAAYVFTRSAGVWTQKDYLKASNTGTNDRFGLSVAVSGHTAIIGASFEDSDATTVGGDGSNDNASEAGAAYIFNLGQAAIAPTVTNVSPATGSTAGGRSVTITGMDFTGATAVTFGGTAATSFTVDSATQITAVTPAGSAGAVSVLVTTAGGTNAANTLFTYIAPPTVTNVNPATGSTVGGTSVTITGTNFTGATGVTFGGAPASRVRVFNATTISATTPAGTAGPASVLVTTAGGTNAANTLFTYVVPNSAPSFNLPLGDLGPAGVVWTQRTSGFSSWSAITSSADGSKLAAVIFGGLIFTSADSGVTWTARDSSRNWTSITSSADGSKLAAVVSGGQIYTSTDSGVTWTARDSSRNWSSIASSADGSKLAATAYAGSIYTSTDSGLTWTAQASGTFNWQTIASSADGSKLVAGAYGGQVYTSTDSGVTWTARDSSRNWNSIASSTDGSKLAAAVLGGQIYTSTDSGVTWTARDSSRNWNSIASSADGSKLVATVNFNFVYISGDSGVTWTAQDTSRRWIAVASSADGSKLAAAVFNGQIFTSVPAPLPPVVKALAGSGTSTTPNFAFNISPGPVSDNGQTVSFTVTNNNNALFTTQPAIANDGTLTFTPGNTVGSAIVTVTAVDNGGTAAGGVDSSAAQTFTIQVLPPAPTVANVAPSSGTTLGGTSVTITGTEFTNATAVTFGGTAATSFTVDSATQITAVTPAGTAGAASVLVTTPSGTNAANTLFTYVVPNFAPVITSNGGDATASINVAENSTAVTTVTATDADLPAQTLTFTKSGADAALFNLDSATGVLRFIAAPNFEAPADSGLNNIYDVTVTVTDSGTPAMNDVQALTIIVTDVNESPAVRASSSFLAYETVNPTRDGAGLIVYTANNAAALAAQPFNRVRYRMDNTTGGVAYYADASFDAWGGLTVAGLKVPDAGNIVTTQRSVTNVSIRSNHPGVTNSNTEQGRLELWTNDYATTGIIGGSSTVYDYDDTPQSPVIGYGSFQLHNLSTAVPHTVFAWNRHGNGSIPEVGFGNATIGIHPDWTFTNTGTNAWRMQIYIENNFVPPTMSFTEDVVGNILFFNSPFLDDSASLTVTLSIADGTITGNAGTGITVGGTAISRTFTGSVADLNAYFTTPGKVTYLGALNNTVSRTLTVSVSDGSLSTSTTSTIHLAPVNDVPTDIAVTPSNVPENNEPNVVVGTLSTTDPDVGDTFSYSLVTGAGDTDNGSFFIVGNILRITPGVDFETKPSYSIRVRSTEASTAFIEKALTINVRDLLEQEIAYDDFRRPSDSGNGWSTNWSVANPAVANLVYPPLNSGGQAAGSGAGQRFRTLGVAQTTGVVYVSALLKGGGYCNIALFDNSLEKVSFGVVYDPLRGTFNPNFGLFDETRRFEGGAAMVPTAVPIDSATHLILARVDLDLNTVEMWLDPNLALPLGAPNCTSRAGVASGGNYDFNRVRLEVTGTAVMDEPRIMAGDRRFVAERVTSASIASPSVTNVKNTRATLGGDISQTGGTAILERGVVYSATAVNSNPEVGGTGVFQATASGTSTGTFTVNVAGLVAGTNYRFKAYARNAIGTTYTLTTGSFQTLSVPESIPGDSGDVISNSLATGADGTSTIGNYGVLRRGGFLAENGVFAYPGYLLMGSGSPPVTTANNSGIWKVQGGNPLLVARTGATVPDVPGALFATVPEVPGLSESGDVSMLSTLVIGSGGVTSANDTGLWSEIGGGGLRLLLREDDNVPSLPGVKVGSFASGLYATARTGASTGEAVFSVTYKGASTKTALLRTSVSGATTTVSVVAQEGEVAPGASPAANYANVAGSYSDPGRMDAQGNFVYAALTTPGNKEGIWYQPVTGGTPSKVFFAGETAPGTGGATFARLQRPSMGSNGFISFRATLNRDGDNAANARNDGIWNGSASNPASFTCVLRRGDGVAKVSNLPVGSLVGNPWGGWLTNSNLGAWRAWLDVDGDGISSTADGDVNAIFANLSGAMQLAVKVGDAAPGTAGASFSGFDLPMVGGNNQYAILGNLTGGDTVTGNNQGLWKSGPNGGALTLAIRKGESIPTTEGPKVVTKIDVPGSNQTDRRWEQPVMDSTGRMVVYVTFADGSTSQVIIP